MTAARHPNYRPSFSLPVELRRTTIPNGVREWVAHAAGSQVRTVRRLPGASTSAVHRLDLTDGSVLVLRRYLWRCYVQSEPDAPGREADALRFARLRGLPVPELVAADPTGSEIGDGVPVLLMTFVPGRAVAVPDLHQLAEAAAAIHSIDAEAFGHDYYGWYEPEMTTPPPWTRHPELWERAIELWRDHMPSYRAAFVHRDFHPGNVLWSRGRLSGVVDWAAACRGPIGCDLAHCRSNLRDLSGPSAGDAFAAAYEAITGEPLDPFWIMAGHLEHSHDHWTPAQLSADEPDLAAAVRAFST
jgi:Ser/Thr protein kinase RdoA (MazF antagonist)